MSPTASLRLVSAMALALGVAAASITAAHAGGHATTARRAALHGYTTEAEAQTGCAGDTVVWRAHESKVFHTAGSKYFGKTRHGAFVCEKAAEAKGLRAARS